MPCVRRARRSSRAGVIQPLSGPAGLGDHGRPRVSQLQSRCSRALSCRGFSTLIIAFPFFVRGDEKLTAFLELEIVTRESLRFLKAE
jgi:hypothetical protein